MTGMAVLLLVRPIVRHRDRFAQSDGRVTGGERMENIWTKCESIEARTLARGPGPFLSAARLAQDAEKRAAPTKSAEFRPRVDGRDKPGHDATY